MSRGRHRTHVAEYVPDARIIREGQCIGYNEAREPLYTWWNPGTSAWELHVLPHVGTAR